MSQRESRMSEYLLVPTNVQAFVVGSPGDDRLYDLAPVPRTEEDIASWYVDRKYSFSFGSSKLLQELDPGIHLHWALPAALMHSHHEGGKEPEQPCIPNRWLVLRMWHAADNRNISWKAWVIESDYVSLDAASGGTPFFFFETDPPVELNGKHCGYVGRTVPLEGWQETHEKYRFELKSFGWGDPSFAAYYPACKGVLGFHDTLEGLKQGYLLTYLVIGWYSDPARDPLHRINQTTWQANHGYAVGDIVTPTKPNGHQYRVTKAGTSGSVEPSWPETGEVCNGPVIFAENGADVLATLGWSCSNLDSATLAQRTLCHGGVVGVKWQGRNEKYLTSPVGTSATVAIGGSAAEAFAALLASDQKQVSDQKSLQQVLCAFQHGQATQVSEMYELGDLLHRHGFGAVPGGKLWSIEPVDPPPATPGDTPPGAKSSPPPMSANVQNLLRKLNEVQQALDRQARKVESLRSRLFACWATWASKQTGPPPRPSRDSVNSAEKELEKVTDGLRQYEDTVTACRNEVTNALAAEETGMQLAESTMPPFLHPKEPFVVLTSDNLVGVDRAHAQRPEKDADGSLHCRLAKDVVTGVSQRGTISKELSARNCFMLDFPNAAGVPPGEVVRTLALETLLFDPNCASLIVGTEELTLFKQLQESLDQSRGPDSSNNTLTWTGLPPDPLGVTRRAERNPWLPVYLMWQAHWVPAYTPVPESDNSHSKAFNGWQLDSNPLAGDLVPQEGAMPPLKDHMLLEGATIISTLSGTQLANNLSEFAETAGGNVDNLERITQMQVLGQALGGLNDLLVRQTLGLCLPPVCPKEKQVDTTVWEAMGQVPQPTMPVTGSFLPVRAGALKLVNLFVVDSFGQTQKLIDSASSLAAQPPPIRSAVLPKPPDGYHAGFSPRLVQPTRLNFDWQPAEDANSSGPVCGWIVPNFLEKSFAVFSAGGEPLGALESVLLALGKKTIESKVKFNWHPIPGSTLEIEKIGNSRLQRFVKLVTAFTADEGQAFLELVDLVLRRTEGRVPADDPAMAVLLGRPLALVHASLGLELQGLPVGYWDDQKWKFVTEGFEKLRVPVRLGGMNLPADGLVGYMRDNDESCFFASEGATRSLSSDKKIKYDQDLTPACADEQPVSLTLLMDASARVHATTGILPRHRVSLPAEAVRLAGLIKEIYIAVAPVLGERPREGVSQPTMPKPSDAFGQWSWATRPDLTTTPQTWHDIKPADDRARFADDLALSEGWLRLQLQRDQGGATPADHT
jgi:hypothetical protein